MSLLTFSLTQSLAFLALEGASWEVVGSRVIFLLTYFLVVITIGLNIVLSIIVNTFWEIRMEAEKTAKMKEFQCFVCDLTSPAFERTGTRFPDHQNKQHNMWNYVHYMDHVLHKDVAELTATELYVRDCLRRKYKNRSVEAWFPIGRAVCLGDK